MNSNNFLKSFYNVKLSRDDLLRVKDGATGDFASMMEKFLSWVDDCKKADNYVIKESKFAEEEFIKFIQTFVLNCAMNPQPFKEFAFEDKMYPYKMFEGLVWGQKVLKPTGDDQDKVSYSFLQKMGLPFVIMRSNHATSLWWESFASDEGLPIWACSPLLSCVRIDNRYVSGMYEAFIKFDMRTSSDYTKNSRHWSSILIMNQIRPDMTYMSYLSNFDCCLRFLNFGDTIVSTEYAIKPKNKDEAMTGASKVKQLAYYEVPTRINIKFVEGMIWWFSTRGRIDDVKEELEFLSDEVFAIELSKSRSDDDVSVVLAKFKSQNIFASLAFDYLSALKFPRVNYPKVFDYTFTDNLPISGEKAELVRALIVGFTESGAFDRTKLIKDVLIDFLKNKNLKDFLDSGAGIFVKEMLVKRFNVDLKDVVQAPVTDS